MENVLQPDPPMWPIHAVGISVSVVLIISGWLASYPEHWLYRISQIIELINVPLSCIMIAYVFLVWSEIQRDA